MSFDNIWENCEFQIDQFIMQLEMWNKQWLFFYACFSFVTFDESTFLNPYVYLQTMENEHTVSSSFLKNVYFFKNVYLNTEK